MTTHGARVANPSDPAWAQVMGGSIATLNMPETGMPRMLSSIPTYASQDSVVMPYMPAYDANRFGQPTMGMPPAGPLSGAPFDNSPFPGDRPVNIGDLGFPSGMQSDHPSTAANTQVTYSYALYDMQNAPHRDQLDGQVFLLYHRNHRVQPRTITSMEDYLQEGESERQVGMTLAVANAILAQDPFPEEEDYFDKDYNMNKNGPRWVEDVLDEWSFIGFPVTEEGEKQTERGNEQYRSRFVNSVIRGPADAHDIWSTAGSQVDAGTKLWLILKKVEWRDRYILDAGGQFVRYFKANDIGHKDRDNNTEKFTNRPFQFVPYASTMYERPPLSALEYEDEFGQKQIGAAIPVGTVHFPPGYQGLSPAGLEPHVNVSHIPKLPKMEVFVQPRCA